MNILYRGKYKKRFKIITDSIDVAATKSIAELCFGDIFIAEFCKNNKIYWVGYDINANFVKKATSQNYHAICADISHIEYFDFADIYIMQGALYHFRDSAEVVLRKMLAASNQLIISEPIINLSSSRGILGYIAKRSTNIGKGEEQFRFNYHTFIDLIDRLNVEYKIISQDRDIVICIKNDTTKYCNSGIQQCREY